MFVLCQRHPASHLSRIRAPDATRGGKEWGRSTGNQMICKGRHTSGNLNSSNYSSTMMRYVNGNLRSSTYGSGTIRVELVLLKVPSPGW